jgi:hypothetical protein
MKKSNYIYLWALLPAALFFNSVLTNAKNVPILDDYNAILDFVYRFKGLGLKDKFIALFQQHNEHRIFLSRVVYVTYYQLFGEINFRNLIFIADLQLIPVALIGIYFIQYYLVMYRNIAALIWCLCVFDLNSYEAATWAMCGMQAYGVIMLFFISLFCYHKDRFWLGAIAQAICIFSSGNGILAGIVLTVFSLRKSKSAILISVMTNIICIVLYILTYVKPVRPDYTFDLTKAIDYFIQMTGAHLSFHDSFIFGAVILAALILFIPWKVITVSPSAWAMTCILLFCFGSMLTITMFRSQQPDAQFQTSRYLIYPQIISAVTAATVIRHFWRLKFWVVLGTLLVCIHVYVCNYRFGEKGVERTHDRCETYRYWYPDPVKAEAMLSNACNAGIYCLDDER